MSNQFWADASVSTVIKMNRFSETDVWSSGGGGYIDPKFGGHVAAAQVHSNITQRAEVFHRDDNGNEKSDDLGFTGIKMREGSRIFILWGAEKGVDSGHIRYVENLDTGESWCKKAPVKPPSGLAHFLVGFITLMFLLYLFSFMTDSLISQCH